MVQQPEGCWSDSSCYVWFTCSSYWFSPGFPLKRHKNTHIRLMGEPKLPLGASKFAAFHTFIYYFTRLAGGRQKRHPHVMPFTHKQTLLCCSLRSVNLGSTLAFHMTEVECEIPAQTFMRADLHYITSVPHHGRQE